MYTKTEGHHCWWLNKNGKALANFDKEKDVDDIIRADEKLDKATAALEGIYESGIKLDEYENPVRDALGLTVFN